MIPLGCEQHGESTLAIPGFIVLGIERTRSVEVDARARPDTAHRHQPERRRVGALALLERVVQGLGNERAHADAPGGRFAAHLPGESVIKGNGRSHGEENNNHASMHQRVSFELRNGRTVVEAKACPVAGYLPFDAIESRFASR